MLFIVGIIIVVIGVILVTVNLSPLLRKEKIPPTGHQLPPPKKKPPMPLPPIPPSSPQKSPK